MAKRQLPEGSDSGKGVEVGRLVGLGEVVGSFHSDGSVQPARRTRPDVLIRLRRLIVYLLK